MFRESMNGFFRLLLVEKKIFKHTLLNYDMFSGIF